MHLLGRWWIVNEDKPNGLVTLFGFAVLFIVGVEVASFSGRGYQGTVLGRLCNAGC